jgi:hypothetical protein
MWGLIPYSMDTIVAPDIVSDAPRHPSAEAQCETLILAVKCAIRWSLSQACCHVERGRQPVGQAVFPLSLSPGPT